MDFEIVVSEVDGVPVVRVFGEVDIYSAPRLAECLEDLVADGKIELAVDLEHCTYMDSEGIKVLVSVIRSIGQEGSLTICCAPSSILRTLHIVGLDSLLRIIPSMNDLKSE